ncbi:MAG TPA: alpha/beta hydrolase [Myxococcales bacterium]|jgi:pimeloyl-ACP methyl ester carboxylesterase
MANLTVGTENGNPVELYYEDKGQGRPVVLIHGWPLSSRSWEPQVPALVDAGCRVITYDRRGFGWSSQPWSGYDYDTLTADLSALLDKLDLKDATLVGFSMGGGEVARYVGKYGTKRVSRAVFASAVPPYLYKSTDHPEGGLDDSAIGQYQAAVRSDRLAFLDGWTRTFYSVKDRTDLVGEPLRQYTQTIAAFASPKGTVDCIAAFARTDFRGDLKKFNIPTLVIHGDSDAVVPYEVSGRYTHVSIPYCELALIKGAPHGVNVTHAKQFNEALVGFLNKK